MNQINKLTNGQAGKPKKPITWHKTSNGVRYKVQNGIAIPCYHCKHPKIDENEIYNARDNKEAIKAMEVAEKELKQKGFKVVKTHTICLECAIKQKLA